MPTHKNVQENAGQLMSELDDVLFLSPVYSTTFTM